MNNIEIVNSYVKNMEIEFFQMIERELEYIINSPSTINSIFKYYNVARDEKGDYYLIFNKEKVIKRYTNPQEHHFKMMNILCWLEMNPSIIAPSIIMPPLK